MKSAPQVFHDKEDVTSNFLMFPADLFSAVNSKCNGNEAKVLLTLLGCTGDGSFSPSTAYMLKMTGIKKPNHYFEIRKKLEDKEYIKIEDGDIYISIDKILENTTQK